MSQALMTSIVLKSDVTLMDIVSTRMLGQFGFLAKIFNIFKQEKISVDVVATSEIAVSLTLDPRYPPPPPDLCKYVGKECWSSSGQQSSVTCTPARRGGGGGYKGGGGTTTLSAPEESKSKTFDAQAEKAVTAVGLQNGCFVTLNTSTHMIEGREDVRLMQVP